MPLSCLIAFNQAYSAVLAVDFEVRTYVYCYHDYTLQHYVVHKTNVKHYKYKWMYIVIYIYLTFIW